MGEQRVVCDRWKQLKRSMFAEKLQIFPQIEKMDRNRRFKLCPPKTNTLYFQRQVHCEIGRIERVQLYQQEHRTLRYKNKSMVDSSGLSQEHHVRSGDFGGFFGSADLLGSSICF